MTKIETNSSSVATGYAVSPAQAAAPGFSGAMREAQVLPRSAYVPSGEPYDRDKHGSHRVGGVELVPGAPGHDFDRALPWLKEIAATDRHLASYLSSKGIQVGPAMPETLPVEVEPVVIADPDLQAALDEIENSLASQTEGVVTEETASPAVSSVDEATTNSTSASTASTDTSNPSDTAGSTGTTTQNVTEASSLATSTDTTSAASELSNTAAASEAAVTDTAAQTALQTAPEMLLVTSAQYLSQHMELNLATSLMESADEDVTQNA